MKKIKFIAPALIFLIISIVFSCEEIGPPIDFTIPAEGVIDTTFVTTPEAPQAKVVLLEDFTGVQCVNCPLAHVVSDQLLEDHPDNLAVVGLHNFNSCKYTFSNYELCTIEAFEIDDLIGPASGWPVGSIDRIIFPSDAQILTTIDKWPTHVQDQIDNAAVPVNLYLEIEYDALSRELDVIVDSRFTEDVTGTTRLSIMISESDITDPQLTPTGIDTFYLHKHALRQMLTPSTGAFLGNDPEAGRVYIKEFLLTVPELWNDEHLEIVAFVHQSGESKRVLQTAKALVE